MKSMKKNKKKKTERESKIVEYHENEYEIENIVCPHHFSISGVIEGCDVRTPDCENCDHPDRKIVKSTIKTNSITVE